MSLEKILALSALGLASSDSLVVEKHKKTKVLVENKTCPHCKSKRIQSKSKTKCRCLACGKIFSRFESKFQ